jgi:hypothetical protein
MAKRSFPTDDESIDELLDRSCRRFERGAAKRKIETWFPIQLPELTGQAFGVAWVGDPHMDDEYCNWPRLRKDLALISKTKGLYGACVGDLTNNWVGKLIRLYGDQSDSKRTARQKIKWFLQDCGIDWRLMLLGNHDMWAEGDAIIGHLVKDLTMLGVWEAKVEFVAGQHRYRVHAAHSFRGQSILNPTHGLMRAARYSGSPADLYVAGHTHTTASQSFEIGDKYVRHLLVSGYKGHDLHAVTNGFNQAQNGATGVSIFNPRASSAAGRVTIFEDLETGCDVLKFMRAKR